MTLVIDTCVAVKWLVSEVHEQAALAVRSYELPHLAPQHFLVEVTAALRKKVREGDISPADLPAILELLPLLPVVERPVTQLLTQAMDLSVRHSRSIYDSFYVALALHLGCRLVTADRKLYDALAAAYPETMLWIEDVPVP